MAAQLWHKAPWVRSLAALMLGIGLQWHLALPLLFLIITFVICLLFITLYSLGSVELRYRLAVMNGAAVLLLFISASALLVWNKDVRNNSRWAGCLYKPDARIVATLQEPLVEKTNSYKAVAHFTSVLKNDSVYATVGKLILYFKKDSLPPALHYGSQIVFSKGLQEIKNSGNPGGFDYKRYSLFQGITHQAFLAPEDYTVLSSEEKSWLPQAIFNIRCWVIGTLKKYIPGEKESGLAEALLIGYKDDLDKNLVQSYSNTGVVHIIAISGLHLGIIYWLLLAVTKPLKRHKNLIWLRLLLTITALWIFTLLAGAQPSVLRSAIMFTVIAIGQLASRKGSIYNTMALSAFVLLCINPFWLWDVGFQLSYTAVLSIVVFFQPIYNWFYLRNKLIDFFWKLTAVTIAAQLLTLPISIYHFHQMPLLFLLTNFIAVPLSSGILIGEILLCAVQAIEPVAYALGWLLHQGIYFMNYYIEGLDAVPFSVWNGLSISVTQTLLLLVFVVAACYWLMEKRKVLAWTAGLSFGIFMLLRGLSFADAEGQQKLIVYNVPRYPAIDLIEGRSYSFVGDSALLYDNFIRNFHLQPSRIRHRISLTNDNPTALKSFAFCGKQILIIDEEYAFQVLPAKQVIDVIVLSKNPKLYISNLTKSFDVKQMIIDGSVPQWKAALWQKDCDSLHIPCHNVSERGAFVTLQ